MGRTSPSGKRRGNRTFRDAVTANLRSFLKECGGAYALYRDGVVAEGTVKNWAAGRGSLPSLETAATLARHKGLSLNWLVSGNGPRRHDQIMEVPALAEALRAHVVSHLRTRGVGQYEVDRVVWRGEALLERVVLDRLTEVQNVRKQVGEGLRPKAWLGARGSSKKRARNQ